MVWQYRYFRTRGVYASIPAFLRVIKRVMVEEVAPMMMGYAEQTTEGWSEPPWWSTEYRVDSRQTQVGIRPEGPGAQKWYWLDSGVPGRMQKLARPWKPGYKPAIRFRGYSPLTRPGGKFGGPGVYHGAYQYVGGLKAVRGYWWPGIRARNFGPWIQQKSWPEFRHIMENAMRRAVRAAQREGK